MLVIMTRKMERKIKIITSEKGIDTIDSLGRRCPHMQYPIPSASCRTEIGAKVLNDHWVSVTSGSEDYSFKHMRKNQYEESLFRCEDDRFELDMLLELVNTTTERVEELLDNMNAHTYKLESSFSIEHHLSALHMRCIERLYGDHGLDVIDVLRKNTPLALPVILTRLKQKQEEWAKCRADFNKVWAEIYAKNYHKSLDHRSFYFKQQDTKNLSAKALLAEIKESSEKNQNEDEIVLSIASGYTQPTKPHMEFEYPDLNIQEDIYQLMKYSCGEVCTPEQCDKVMKIWTTFLEPMLGVPSCSPGAGDKNYNMKSNNHTMKNLKHIGPENSGHADEVAYCNPADMSKSQDEHIPPEDSVLSGARMTRGNNGNANDGSPGADNIAIKSDLLCNASPTAAREKTTSKKNASATWKEADQANADCGMEMMPSQDSQDDVTTNVTRCSVDMVLKEVKVQKNKEESETCSKGEREEGELSPNRNLENSFIDFGDSDTKTEQTLSKSVPTVEYVREEEMCAGEAGEDTEAIGADEGEERAQVSSDTENVSENGNVLGSESANGEECSPEEPDDDGDHDENNKKAESEGDADCTTSTEGGIPISDCLLQAVKPLTVKVPVAVIGTEKKSHIFYGNDSIYLLFRLHQMLYERMQTAKLHSSTPENKWGISNDANSAESYARFKEALQSLLSGSSDNAKFEDECRALVGAQSYILFTLDKLIHKLVKQLLIIATEELDYNLLHLYAYERSRSPETFSDVVYYENARFLLLEDNLYRIEFLPWRMRLTMQLMKNEHDKLDPVPVFMDPYFTSYLHDELLAVSEIKEKCGVFMKRNKKLYSSEDEYSDACKAMEGLVIRNGVEMKVNCSSLKISYVLDTEDFLYRPRKRRRDLYGDGAPEDCSHRAKRCELMLN